MTKAFSTTNIDILAIGNRTDLAQAESRLSQQYPVKRYRDALHVDMPEGSVFLFDYGVMVAWGLSAEKKQLMADELENITSDVNKKHWDYFQFEILPDAPADPSLSLSNDKLTLNSHDVFVLLSVSHAFAQSSKLEVFEARAEQTILDNRYLAKSMAEKGKIPLSRRQLSKLRGSLFQTKSDIVLNFNLLDTPEFFWEYPLLEMHYQTVAKYLELKPRIEILNLKLQTIEELFNMLATEQNHQHSSFLEWIIIILIAVEIVIFLFE
ncbi:MAG: putative Rmd1/YagE family protein [Paraglaciecola sp.]|jgi:uncharacterized Rmd1/YagE family protein